MCDEQKKRFAEISSSAVKLCGPYCKIQTVKKTNQNSPVNWGPLQSNNKVNS